MSDKPYSIDWVICEIDARVLIAGSIRKLAKKWRLSAPYLSDVLNQRRRPGPSILKRIGLRSTRKLVIEYWRADKKLAAPIRNSQ